MWQVLSILDIKYQSSFMSPRKLQYIGKEVTLYQPGQTPHHAIFDSSVPMLFNHALCLELQSDSFTKVILLYLLCYFPTQSSAGSIRVGMEFIGATRATQTCLILALSDDRFCLVTYPAQPAWVRQGLRYICGSRCLQKWDRTREDVVFLLLIKAGASLSRTWKSFIESFTIPCKHGFG